MIKPPPDDPLLLAVTAMLRELADFPITEDRLAEARPIVEATLVAIRSLDEADVEGLEPATQFAVSQ
jgi:hypothetical protein